MAKKTEAHQTQTITVFVDRVEDGIAIITVNAAPEIHFNLPLQYLPPNVTEGDHLKLTLELDDESKEAIRNRVAALQTELSSEPETNIKL